MTTPIIKYLLIIICFFVCLGTINAHKPSETYTTIEEQIDQLKVQIEFPWTIQEAVKEAFPNVNGAQISDEEASRYLQQYIAANFQIFNQEEVLKPNHFQIIPQEHGHSIITALSYPKVDFKSIKVKNSLLFNLFENQKNYHQIRSLEEKEYAFKTLPAYDIFSITEDIQQHNWSYKSIFLVASVLLSLMLGWSKLN